MKNDFLYAIVLLVILFRCNNNDNKKDIIGITSGYADSTMLILRDIENELVLDTTYILNNKFRFTVSVLEPAKYSITTEMKNRTEFEFIFFWVENKNISIEATKANLRYANVEGSELQNQAEILLANKKPINDRLDSLRIEFMKSDRNDTAKLNSLMELQNELFKGTILEKNEKYYNYAYDLHDIKKCENCLRPLKYSSVNISHILTRGANPEMKYDLRNHNLLCFECHEKWEHNVNNNRFSMNIYLDNNKVIKLLKKDYGNIKLKY